jgi:myo-inositol-1(or 4)-monophosphatase
MLEVAKNMALQAGAICRDAAREMATVRIEYKGATDLVTEVDQRVEDFLIGEIRKFYPDHAIFGEERGSSGTGSYRWVIDPIDGTNSFIQGLPWYGVSIAVKVDGDARIGVVYAPVLEQLFYASKGEGAYLNGRRLQVSATAEMLDAVMATGFACVRAGLKKNNLDNFCRIVPKLRDVRRLGSAALDLAYVAAGKLDGFWELALNEYDVAAGVLLVEEAGGRVCDFHGGPAYPEQGIVATNGRLTERLLALLVS